MRIRTLAVAVVTAGALMATLTGAASAATPTPAPVPTPAPGNGIVLIACEGGGHVTLVTRSFTEAELKEMKESGAALTMPAVPALPLGKDGEFGKPGQGGEFREPGKDGELGKPGEFKGEFRKAEPGRVTTTEDMRVVRPGVEPPAPPKDAKVMATPAPVGVAKPVDAATLSMAVPVPEGAAVTEVRVAGKLSEGGAPAVTCAKKAEGE
ncbi:hypothetical protein [Streptosporangium sp. NBC_01469]|uniref:hypothetical protein n=1 Tax=Streptosporangium sp. NBC_01469 TaxID=2903898 RepID=UPI002E28D3C3|nr:hypothetical protein [Streptosporangium sp. NBC_01469]